MSRIASVVIVAVALSLATSAAEADISYIITPRYSDAFTPDGITESGPVSLSKPYGSPIVLELH